MKTPLRPGPLEGQYFVLQDLQMAVVWAVVHPTVKLLVVLDHPLMPEAIHVCSLNSTVPHWCIWRDHTGRIHIDDWSNSQFDLPYPSMMDALGFIGSELADALRRRSVPLAREDRNVPQTTPRRRKGDVPG